MALRNVLILRKPRSGYLEGRTVLIRVTYRFFHRVPERPQSTFRSVYHLLAPGGPVAARIMTQMSAHLYILCCADGSYYVGTTRDSLEKRLAEHQAGTWDGYTSPRRPVTLIFSQHFQRIEDAVSAERQIKGWRREKKEALIRGNHAALPALARRSSSAGNAIRPVRPSRRGPEGRSSG
jgi:putative endonuclease